MGSTGAAAAGGMFDFSQIQIPANLLAGLLLIIGTIDAFPN